MTVLDERALGHEVLAPGGGTDPDPRQRHTEKRPLGLDLAAERVRDGESDGARHAGEEAEGDEVLGPARALDRDVEAEVLHHGGRPTSRAPAAGAAGVLAARAHLVTPALSLAACAHVVASPFSTSPT